MIWTTTPWTLPANQAVCVHPELHYNLVRTPKGLLVLAEDLRDQCLQRYGLTGEVLATARGQALEGVELYHPFYERKVPVVLGSHVTLDAGTGLVHTAPAHGLDDYVVGMRYNLPTDNPVDDNGRFYDWAEIVAGMSVWDANQVIIDTLEQNQRLLKAEKLTHSYPVCWRHKTPIIFRATPQWFIGMDSNHRAGGGPLLRELARQAVADTEFFPASGTRAPGCDGRQPAGLVRLPAAQLGRADGAVRAQGHRRSAPAHRRAHGAGGGPGRGARDRCVVRSGCGGVAGRAGAGLPESLRHHGCVVRIGHHARQRAGAARRARPSPPICTSKAPTSTAGGSRHRCWPDAPSTDGLRTGRSSLTASSWTAQGRKMSKSLGTGIAPQEVSDDARRGDPAPVGGLDRLLRRAVDLPGDPQARGRDVPAHPQHAALPAGERVGLRSEEASAPGGAMDRAGPLRAAGGRIAAGGGDARLRAATSSTSRRRSCTTSAPSSWAPSTSTFSRTGCTRPARRAPRAAPPRARCTTSPTACCACSRRS